MKQYELKFYKEWYDALSELSHEDRANAVLALLEYLYDGIVPDDQFIRIVTTLMRNKIDREKAAYEKRTKAKESSSDTPTEQVAVENDNQSVEQVPENDNSPEPEQQPSLPEINTIIEASPDISENDADGIDEIIREHYNPDIQLLQNFCKRNSCDIKDLALQAKKIMTQWVTDGSWHPTKLPDRSKESILWKLDKLALANIKSSSAPIARADVSPTPNS